MRTFQARGYLGKSVFWEPFWELKDSDAAAAFQKAGRSLPPNFPVLETSMRWRKFLKELRSYNKFSSEERK